MKESLKFKSVLTGYIVVFLLILSFTNSEAAQSDISSTNTEINDVTPPIFIPPTPLGFIGANVCLIVTFTVAAQDTGPGAVTLTVTGLPTGSSMTPNLPTSGNPVSSSFSWFPALNQLGTYNVVFTATDSSGNQTDHTVMIDFALSNIPQTPEFALPTPVCGTIIHMVYDTNITFPVVLRDDFSNYDTITLDVTGLPSGATMTPPLPRSDNPVLSRFNWTPQIGQVGSHTVTFTATNVCGVQTTCTISFDIVLPVELTSFTSTTYKNDVILKWTTSSEINNSMFEVERKVTDSQEWTRIGTLKGKGNSSVSNSYTYTDKISNPGTYHYRLKQIDFNGNFEYHNLGNEVEINAPTELLLLQNYPNPFNPVTKIDFEIPNDGKVSLFVYDNNGKLITTLINDLRTAGYYSEVFNASNVSSGVYYYKINYISSGKSFQKVMKMILVK